jgi:HlyD family secretion protein
MADREAEARIGEAQRNIDLMEKELADSSAIKSPYTGKVIELKVYTGSPVTAGEPVLSLEPSADRMEGLLYISSAKVKEIHPGMPVEIAPTSIQREEYGFMRARVTSVAEFPATKAAVLRNFENEALVNALAAGGPVNEVRVELLPDPKTPSGFQWSSSKGPSIRITSGTLCAASIVTRDQTPLSLVIPFLKEKVGLN